MLTIEEKIDRQLVRLIRMGFVLLLLFVPLYFAFDTKELFEFNKMLAVYLLAIVITGAWLARMVVQRRFIWQATALDIPLLLFLISQLLSTIFSIHPYTSLLGYYSRFHGGLLSTISYLLLYWSFVTHVRKKDLSAYFFSALIGGFLVTLYAIPEHFGHSPSCLLISDWRTFDASCWKQDVQSRVFATFGQPNWLAAYVITLLPLSSLLAFLTQRLSARLFAALTTLTLFLTLLFTQSRSGLLGLAVGVAVAGVLGTLYLARQKKLRVIGNRIFLRRALYTLLPVCIALLFFGSIYTPSLQTLLQRTAPVISENQTEVVVNRLDVGGSSSAEIRKIVWRGALAVWKRYPWLGSGVETFAYSYYLDRPVEHNQVSEWNFLYNKAHNEFLNLLATTGIVGLLTYSAILLTAGVVTLRQVTMTAANRLDTATAIALWSGIVALSTSNFFGFSTVMVTVLLFFYLAILNLMTEKARSSPTNLAQPPIKNLRLSSWVNLAIIAGFTGMLVFSVLQTRRADVAYARGSAETEQHLWEAAFQNLTTAHTLAPLEAQYSDTLALTYAQAAIALGLSGDATSASQLATTAISLSDQTLTNNPEQRNFYKTRAQIFLLLAQLDPLFFSQARAALETAIGLAPTDAKTMYNLGIISGNQGDTAAAVKWLQQAVAAKPDYDSAHWELGKQLLQLENYSAAANKFEYILTRQPGNEAAQQALELAKSQTAHDK